MEKVALKVEGMSCVNCARAIEVSLNNLKGVKEVQISFELGRVFVEYDENFLDLEEIKGLIEGLGYRVASQQKKREYEKEILVFSFIASLLIMGLMFYHHPFSLLLQALLSVLVQVIGGVKFLPWGSCWPQNKGWKYGLSCGPWNHFCPDLQPPFCLKNFAWRALF